MLTETLVVEESRGSWRGSSLSPTRQLKLPKSFVVRVSFSTPDFEAPLSASVEREQKNTSSNIHTHTNHEEVYISNSFGKHTCTNRCCLGIHHADKMNNVERGKAIKTVLRTHTR